MNTLPDTMAALSADFRTKTSFTHIQRLHMMVYAYGATIIEIVRRKEFGIRHEMKATGVLLT